MIAADPQTLASCHERAELLRRLEQFRNVHGLRIRRLNGGMWEDVTEQFRAQLAPAMPPDLHDFC